MQSIIDGCCNTNKIYFSHNDPTSLKIALMKATGYQNKLVIIDGVYSMDGDIALLDEIMAITKEEHAWLMVDESHATGVVGGQGKGTHSHFGLSEKATILTGSLGKALGGSGGYVAGSSELVSFLEITSRPFIFPLPYLNTALRSCQRRFVYLKPVTVHSTGFGRILTTSNVEWTRSVLSQGRLLQRLSR